MKNTNKVITYAFNYEHNFLLKAFKSSLGEHLQNKFNNYYQDLEMVRRLLYGFTRL